MAMPSKKKKQQMHCWREVILGHDDTHMVTRKDDVNRGQYPAVCTTGVTHVSVGIHALRSKNDALYFAGLHLFAQSK